MSKLFTTVALSIAVGSTCWFGVILYRYAQAGPLTTVTPYSLALDRAALDTASTTESGFTAVLDLLADLHVLIDRDFVAARKVLGDRLEVEVKLADAAGAGQVESAAHLLNVGVTATALGDLDRCEYELRQAAALASQLVIDTDESMVVRLSSEVFDGFNAHIRAAERFLTRLNQAKVDSVASWDTWGERLADGQRRLRVRWGIAEDRARSGSIDSELSRRQIANDDLQKIGQDELTRWRKG